MRAQVSKSCVDGYLLSFSREEYLQFAFENCLGVDNCFVGDDGICRCWRGTPDYCRKAKFQRAVRECVKGLGV